MHDDRITNLKYYSPDVVTMFNTKANEMYFAPNITMNEKQEAGNKMSRMTNILYCKHDSIFENFLGAQGHRW